jgi:uncharacterized protein (DUF849 family)
MASLTSKVWLEVALNGAWSKARQPLAPYSIGDIIDEGVACAAEGAAVVHLHAYDPHGQPWEDADTYTKIIEGIRSRCDAIVYPTIAFTPDDPDSERRYAPLRTLSEGGLLEWMPIDPGSISVNRYDDIRKGAPGRFYLNSDTHTRRGLEFCAEKKHIPSFAIYEPGFVRLGAALAAATPGVATPLYRFMFTAQRAWGFPAETFALESYQKLLDHEAPGSPWMIAGHEVDLRPLIPETVNRGGHIRVGLEDAPFGSEMRNIAWVKDAVAAILNEGRTLANPSEIRASFA